MKEPIRKTLGDGFEAFARHQEDGSIFVALFENGMMRESMEIKNKYMAVDLVDIIIAAASS